MRAGADLSKRDAAVLAEPVRGVAHGDAVDEAPIAARAAKFAQGYPFVGQYVDEAVGALGGEGRMNEMRRLQSAMDTARPIESAAWETGGGVAGGGALAGLAGPAMVASAPATLAGRAAAGVGAGALAGGLEGAVSGYGAGNDGDRLGSAATSGAVGAGMGGILGGTAPLAADGIRRLVEHVKGTDVAGIASTLGIGKAAAKAVKEALNSEDTAAAVARLQRAGPNAMLAEGGPSLQAMADAVASSGGEATRVMRGAVDQRVKQGAADATQAVTDAFRPGTSVIPKPPKLGTLYDTAYSKPIDYSTSVGREIEGLMKHVPKEAVSRARKLIEMDPDIPQQIKQQFLVSIQPDGTFATDTLPSVLELDDMTRALNDVAKAGDGKGALGGNTTEGRTYGKLSSMIRDRVKTAVPEYRTALEAASTEIGIKTARDFGALLLRQNTTRREAAEGLQNMPQAERLAVKTAVREQIDDAIANTRRTLSRPGTEAGEATKLIKDLSSRAAQEKLGFLLGDKEAKTLAEKLDEASTAFEIASALHQNSKTAVRQAVQGSIEQSTAPGTLGKLLQGEPLQAGKRLTQVFTGSTAEAQAARQAGIYAEIARALTETKGAQAEMALSTMNQLMAGQTLTTVQAQRLARQVTSVLAASGYSGAQAATR